MASDPDFSPNEPDPAAESAQTAPAVSPDSLMMMDLTVEAPPGLPRLTPAQQALLRRRLSHPTEGIEASRRACGLSPRQGVHKKVAACLAAAARWRPPGAVSAADLRASAVDRLRRIVAGGQDRDAVQAARILSMMLPPDEDNRAKPLETMTDTALLSELRAILSEVDLSDALALIDVTPSRQRTSGPAPLPAGGTGGDQTEEGPGGGAAA